MRAKIGIIGSGFAGLAAACSLAQKGHEVTILEKNASVGGRARVLHENNFVFDMGPSWYWMPDIFEDFFGSFNKKVSDYYHLIRLDPSYQVILEKGEKIRIPASLGEFKTLLETIEPGAGKSLDAFLQEAKVKYESGMRKFVWKPSLSVMEYADFKLVKESFRLQLFANMKTHLRKYFSHPDILKLLEFPVLFLGAKPEKTPALYSMMNYADITLGTWYPQGGMFKIVEGITKLAEELGVKILTNQEVKSIQVQGKLTTGVKTAADDFQFDVVIGAGDYHHIETNLLEKKHRSYSDEYWNSRVMSPSSLLFYVGVDKRIDGLEHHNLFFDEPFEAHATEIYDAPNWPEKPLFYVCCPSKTDNTVAPTGAENLFILIPVAPGLHSDETLRKKYFDVCMERMEKHFGQSIRQNVISYRSYAHEEFIADYHSFKGNAYGLANTLMQTAFLKPRMKSKRIDNLFYAGQLTVPGPGVPPSLISGQIAASEVDKYLKIKTPVTARLKP
ncbi:MAG: phytoene desaturase family protein [Flavobacteriales bacterium]